MKNPFYLSTLLILVFFMMAFCGSESKEVQLPAYPSYKVVAIEFLNDYSIAGIEYPKEFQLVKKTDGWHALIVDIVSDEVEKDALYWDRKKGKFLKVDFPTGTNDLESAEMKQIIDNWQSNYFTKISPFWGYPGWDKDVISVYGEMDNLSDTLLNALARAYASAASNLLNNNTGLAEKDYVFKLPSGLNALLPEQLAMYREIQHKSVDTYYQLWQKNPHFESFVADAYNIYSSEIMNAYLTLRYHQNREEARKELKDDLYDDFFIEMAKNFLSSCDSNAILFVNGDSDTYPLLYLQENKGFRKDVSVVNLSMLNSSRYVSCLIEEGELEFSLTKDFYEHEDRGVVYVQEKVKAANISEVFGFISSENLNTKVQAGDTYFSYLPTRNLSFDFLKQDVLKYYEDPDRAEDGSFSIKIENNYLYRSQLAFLDLLSTNAFKRPVYFALTVGRNAYFGLEEQFQMEGVALKIMPEKQETKPGTIYPGKVDTRVQNQRLMKDFRIGAKSVEGALFEAHQRFVSVYRMVYNRFAEELIDEGDNEKALEALNYCYDAYPNTIAPFDFLDSKMIRSFYSLGEIERGNAIAEALLLKAEGDAEGAESGDYERQRAVYVLKELSDITQEFVSGSAIDNRVREAYEKALKKVI